MELRRGSLALLVAGGLALVASACSSTPSKSDTTVSTAAPGSPIFAQAGTVTVSVPYLPTNFNPSTPEGSNRVTQMVMEQVWPQAFVIDPQFQAQTTGVVDQAEVVNLRPMTVAYQIDPHATWSDGIPITAGDFVYNWHQQVAHARDLPIAGPLIGYRDIKSIVPTNSGRTATVTFKQNYSDWESLFANLIPAHIAERSGWTAAFEGFRADNLISGGPFEVTSVVPGKQLVLSRNPAYWGAPAHLQRIVLVVNTSDAGALSGVEHGTVSVAEVAPGPGVRVAVARARQQGHPVSSVTSVTSSLWQLVFNLNDPGLGDLVMRRALVDVTDCSELVADSIGFRRAASRPASSRVYSSAQPGAQFENPALASYSPVRAAALFAGLGYLRGSDGYLRLYGVGEPLTFTVHGPAANPVISRLEEQLQAEWNAAGIRLVIRNVPLRQLLSTLLPQGRYQVAIVPYVMPAFPTWNAIIYTDSVLPPPFSGRRTLGRQGAGSSTGASRAIGSPGNWLWSVPTPAGTQPGAAQLGVVTRNITGLENAHVAVRFQELIAALNTSQAEQLLSKLDTLLWHLLPTMPLFQVPVSLVQQENLVNVSESPTWAGPFWDAQDWAIQLSPPVTTPG